MAYQPPNVTETGLTVPTYNDLRDSLMQEYYNIFGNGSYIEIDAADYEWISIVSKYVYDAFLLNQLSYTNRAPSTVIGGEPQDSLYTVNGIRRKSASHSTCVVKLTGTPNTIINNGVVRDVAGNLWNLISQVQIGLSGTVFTTATAQQEGNIIALVGDIRFINTPTFGWASVINEEQALTGSAIESNQMFRERRMQSVSNPSRTVMDGIIGGVADVEGVTRFRGYENDTGSPDENGLPAHSICMVVEGGDKNEIANQIYLRKTPGCDTVGDQIVTIMDRFNHPNIRRFYYARYQNVYITINVKKLLNFTDDDINNIKAYVKAHVDGLQIGEPIFLVDIIRAAMDANLNRRSPTFTVQTATMGSAATGQTATDVEIPFNYIGITSIGNIVVNAV